MDFMERVKAQYPTSIENEELNALLQTIYNQEQEIADLETKLNACKEKTVKQVAKAKTEKVAPKVEPKAKALKK